MCLRSHTSQLALLSVDAAARLQSVLAWVQLGCCWTGVTAVHLQDIHKLGVGITGDAHKLQRDFGVQCNGLVCLSEEASMRLTKEQMPETRGLAGLSPKLPSSHHIPELQSPQCHWKADARSHKPNCRWHQYAAYFFHAIVWIKLRVHEELQTAIYARTWHLIPERIA